MKRIIYLLILLPLAAFAQDPDIIGYRQQDQNSYSITKPEKTSNQNSTKQDTPPANIQVENLRANSTLATENKLCIQGDCKDKWPTLKCAEFNGRPAGESGETFCQSINKTCFAVFVGSGASFFSECSASPIATHKTRCCWVE